MYRTRIATQPEPSPVLRDAATTPISRASGKRWSLLGPCGRRFAGWWLALASVTTGVQAQSPTLASAEFPTLKPVQSAENGTAFEPLTVVRCGAARRQKILRPAPRILPARNQPTAGVQAYRLVNEVALGDGDDRHAVDGNVNLYPELTPLAGPIPELRSERTIRPEQAATTPGSTSPANVHVSVDEALFMPGSVTFRKTAINEVVFVLSDLWGINIVAGSDVSGEVSGTFRDAPLSEVLNAVLTSTGYGYRRIGESLIVLPLDQLDRMGQVGSGGSPSSGLAAAGASGSGGFPQVVGGTGLTIQYFTLQFTEAEQMAVPLQQALGEQVVVAVYPEENRLMIRGTSADLALAQDAISQLDRPRSQVRITAMIYDVGLGELQNIGINWSRDVRGITDTLDDGIAAQEEVLSDFLSASSNLVNGGTSIGLRTIRSNQATSLLLEMLNATSESKLLADPSITVADRREASIRIVQRIPIITANPVENSNAVFTQTQFEEAGVILNVTPRISRDRTIELKVNPEYSVVTEIRASGPVIDSRTAETTVRVTDGQMFVLGGLRQKTIVETVRGVPVLRDLKFIGRIFRGHSTEVRESELIVFLKPEIVEVCSPANPRAVQAYRVGNEYLDRIAYAENLPQTPCCCDPECPNHAPRPRINGGTEGLIGGSGCIHAGDPEYQWIPGQHPVFHEGVIVEPANPVEPAKPVAPAESVAPAEPLTPDFSGKRDWSIDSGTTADQASNGFTPTRSARRRSSRRNAGPVQVDAIAR